MVYTQITKSDYIFLNVSACKGRETHIINGYKIKLPSAIPILKENQIHVHQSARIVQKYKQNGCGGTTMLFTQFPNNLYMPYGMFFIFHSQSLFHRRNYKSFHFSQRDYLEYCKDIVKLKTLTQMCHYGNCSVTG